MKRISILHVGKYYPPHNGGMETHLRDLAVQQAEAADVSVIVANHNRHWEQSTMEGVHITRVARIATIASMPVCPGLPAAIRRSPADLVHIHVPNPGAAFAFLASGHAGKLVITHHADTIGRSVLRWFSDPFVNRLMERASRIIVTSNRYLDTSPELKPFRDKCNIVPLGINIRDGAQTDGAIIQRLRQDFGDRLILAVGRLVPYKGFDILVRAMKDIDAKLILIGEGPQRTELHALAASQGVAGRVTMLGRVEDLGPYFAAASFFVLPSITRAEAFGLVQLEAMAAGLPVVNTNIDSGAAEVSIGGETGITVPPRDTKALTAAMQLLLDRQDLRKQYGEAAMVRVKARFTLDQMAAQTLSLYAEIVGS
jgi:glycosyltransferase involved in cell wall biosynthesis